MIVVQFDAYRSQSFTSLLINIYHHNNTTAIIIAVAPAHGFTPYRHMCLPNEAQLPLHVMKRLTSKHNDLEILVIIRVIYFDPKINNTIPLINSISQFNLCLKLFRIF